MSWNSVSESSNNMYVTHSQFVDSVSRTQSFYLIRRSSTSLVLSQWFCFASSISVFVSCTRLNFVYNREKRNSNPLNRNVTMQAVNHMIESRFVFLCCWMEKKLCGLDIQRCVWYRDMLVRVCGFPWWFENDNRSYRQQLWRMRVSTLDGEINERKKNHRKQIHVPNVKVCHRMKE